ncbi:NAD(P)H-binding protein [Desertihabitans aurantiacus]|uniref:NAD(P)H-binding protein n=1 Tax=Desertihabitans aurantiacus TaxID=2282477 RepID=UPI000DF76AAC|nr:NAD(P)H-binding protein [Desertihabitans aurantiacus]
MNVFVLGVSGRTGRLLARTLLDRGDRVAGLVRREEQRAQLATLGVDATVGQLAGASAETLAPLLRGADAVVFAAGSNAGAREVTAAVDGQAVVETLAAARLADVDRFLLLSVLPEAGRAQGPEEDEEFYFAVKKLVDVTVTLSDLDWVVLRPSLLVDRPGTGQVALGPAQPDDEIPRADVAATLAELLHEPRVRRQLLEVTQGSTPVAQAVRATIR